MLAARVEPKNGTSSRMKKPGGPLIQLVPIFVRHNGSCLRTQWVLVEAQRCVLMPAAIHHVCAETLARGGCAGREGTLGYGLPALAREPKPARSL
jgi:hypothetical protein